MERLAFLDVDRTIRKGSVALGFCKYLVQVGLVGNDFVERDSLVRKRYEDGQIEYQDMVEGVVTIHGSVLSGLTPQQLSEHYDGFIRDVGGFFEWTVSLFELLRANEVRTTLVSAGIRPAIEAIANYVQADSIITSEPELLGGRYTGRVARILHDIDKRQLVGERFGDVGTDSVKIGFGDSTGDVSMLELMDHVFIIEPHQKEMISISEAKGWRIVRERDNLPEMVNALLN